MVQWWYLHFLLPQRPLPSSWQLTESRTHGGSGGRRQDLLLLARLESLLCVLFRLFFSGNLVVSSLPKGGGAVRRSPGWLSSNGFLSVGVTLCLPPWSQNWQTALPFLSDSGIIPIVIWIIWIICNRIEVSIFCKNNRIIHIQPYPPVFSTVSKGPSPRRSRVCAGGHVTGYFAGGSREGLQRAWQTQCCSRLTHLAKLNPNCHMNYSIIFTEISFSPESSLDMYKCKKKRCSCLNDFI